MLRFRNPNTKTFWEKKYKKYIEEKKLKSEEHTIYDYLYHCSFR